ncbi:MAG: ABC transporter permease [Acidobacteriota bacterium]
MTHSAADILARSELEPLEPPRFRPAPYLLEIQSELLQALRQPAFAVPSLLFPAMFYLFFGVVFSQTSAYSGYMLTTYGAFGVIGAALFGFGVSVAIARESGELLLKRVAPVPPGAFLAGKMMTSLVFSCLVLAELFVLGAAFGDVRFERGQWLGLAAVLLLGSLPFAALGLAIGTHTSGKGAPAIINLIYLPAAFLSGLWIPIQVLPEILQGFAVVLPPYHLAQLALGVIDQSVGQPVALHVAVLVAMTAVCLAFAARGFRR